MNKIGTRFKIVFLIAIVLCLTIALQACNRSEWYPIEEGVYYSQKNLAGNQDLSSAKLVITEIDETTYNQANGINVIKDKSSKNTNRYYKIEMSLTDDGVEWYVVSFDCLEPAIGDPQEKRYYADRGRFDAVCLFK